MQQGNLNMRILQSNTLHTAPSNQGRTMSSPSRPAVRTTRPFPSPISMHAGHGTCITNDEVKKSKKRKPQSAKEMDSHRHSTDMKKIICDGKKTKEINRDSLYNARSILENLSPWIHTWVHYVRQFCSNPMKIELVMLDAMIENPEYVRKKKNYNIEQRGKKIKIRCQGRWELDRIYIR